MNASTYRNRIYSNYATHHTGQQIGDMRPYKKSIKDFNWRLQGFLPHNRETSCLDIACGSGLFLHYLRTNGYNDVTGVDVSPEQVKLARQVCPNVHQGDVLSFLSSGVKFDLITMFSIVEHFTRDEAIDILDAVYLALQPGGSIVLITPNADSPFASHMRYGDITHEVIYNKGSLSTLLKVCGFTDCNARETGPVPHGIVSSFRWLMWRVLDGLLRCYRLIEGGGSGNWIFTTEFIMSATKVSK